MVSDAGYTGEMRSEIMWIRWWLLCLIGLFIKGFNLSRLKKRETFITPDDFCSIILHNPKKKKKRKPGNIRDSSCNCGKNVSSLSIPCLYHTYIWRVERCFVKLSKNLQSPPLDFIKTFSPSSTNCSSLSLMKTALCGQKLSEFRRTLTLACFV